MQTSSLRRAMRRQPRGEAAAGASVALALALLVSGALPAAEPAPGRTDIVELIERLGLEEAADPVRDRPGWQRPRRILVRVSDPAWLARMREVAPGVELVAARSEAGAAELAPGADAVVGFCSPALLEAGRNIRWVQAYTAGVEDCVRIPAVRERSILLTNMQRVTSPVIAEHVLAVLFALARGLHVALPQQSERRWDHSAVAGNARVLEGRTLLVVGLGGIGTEVARRAHALGMRVVAIRASGHPGPDFVSYTGRPEELHTLARRADAVVNATPLTEQTRNLFDAKFFAAMKSTAWFINVGRGASVVTDDLIEALRAGTIAGAALDVTEPEPLPADHPLWRAPNLILTPHVAAASDLEHDSMLQVARENLRRYVAGERMLSVVDVAKGY